MSTSEQYPIPPIKEAFLTAMCDTLQLNPKEEHAARDMSGRAWCVWSLANFGGGEAMQYINPASLARWTHGDTWDFFAKETTHRGTDVADFSLGELSQKVDDLYQSSAPEDQERFARVSQIAAGFLIAVSQTGGDTAQNLSRMLPPMPQALIYTKARNDVRVLAPALPQNYEYPLADSPRVVATYGPGLTGMSVAANLLVGTEAIHFVSGGKGGHFISRWLECGIELAKKSLPTMVRHGQMPIPKGVEASELRVPQAFYYSDGIAAAANQMPKDEELDVVLMASVHSAGEEEGRAGIMLADERLRVGGLFVLKAPDVSYSKEGGMDRLAYPAIQAFGSPIVAGPCGMLTQNYDPTQPLTRTGSVMIFQKQ